MTDMSVGGDHDSWIIYDRWSADGYPLVVRARIGNPTLGDFELQHRVTGIRCIADERFVDDRGMPQVVDALYDIEDRLVAELSGGGARAYHTASVTGEGQRVIYFVHDSDLGLESLLASLSSSELSLEAANVEHRQAYRDLVTPTEAERQLNGDHGVISNLQKHGDDGTTPRKSDFWFYGERSKLADLIVELDALGYATERWLDDPCGVVMTRVMPVDLETFRDVTPQLVQLASKHQVEYDGWETVVLQVEPEPVAPPSEIKTKSLFRKLFGPSDR